MPVLNLALSQEPSVLIIGLKLKKPLIISIWSSKKKNFIINLNIIIEMYLFLSNIGMMMRQIVIIIEHFIGNEYEIVNE